MRKSKGILIAIALVGFFLLGSVGRAWAVTTLPDPNDVIAPGETIASQHDDFYAYSLDLNTQLNLSGFELSHRQGLTIYGSGSETDNSGVGAGFPDGLEAPGGSETSFTSGNLWGAGVEVDDILGYLHTFGPDINTPVFIFNNNQTGAGASQNIFMAGLVQVWDPTLNNGKGGEVAHWAFDQDGYPNVSDHLFQVPTAGGGPNPPWVVGLGNLSISNVNYNGVTGTIEASNNLGHNDCEFLGIAPTMDLSQYAGFNYEFRATFYLDGLNNGYDSLYMTGAFALPTEDQNVVPEPASMILMGIGLVGAARLRRKQA